MAARQPAIPVCTHEKHSVFSTAPTPSARLWLSCGDLCCGVLCCVHIHAGERPLGVYALYDEKHNLQYVGYARNIVLAVKV